MTYNRALSRARSLRGWSQATVAEKLGTSRKNVSRWECGETLPSPYFRERLCQLFECDTEALNLLSPSASGHNLDTNADTTKPLPPTGSSSQRATIGWTRIIAAESAPPDPAWEHPCWSTGGWKNQVAGDAHAASSDPGAFP